MIRAGVKRLMTLTLLLTTCVDLCGVRPILAQGQKPNYLWEGWHKVPDPSHVKYKVLHDRVVALSNLSEGCDPGLPFSFEGKVAKVNFGDEGLMVKNFILEQKNGERSFVNVDPVSIDDPGMNRADFGWIVQGLQTLLRPGRYIQGSVFACGASGSVVVLDKIVEVSPIKPSK